MDRKEYLARELHKQGLNCSKSLHTAFKEDDKTIKDEYPAPRSIDGKCGAVLVTEAILSQKGLDKFINEYEETFIKNHGSIICKELTGNRNKCNDYIGFSAKYLKDKIKKESD